MLTRKELKEYSMELQPFIKSKKPIYRKNGLKEGQQSLYGDILDYIRDNMPNLRNDDYDDDLLAHYAIGEYIIKNCLLQIKILNINN